MSRPERLALVDHDDQAVPVVAQCRLLKVARSTLYYRPAPVSVDDLAVMRRIDELYLASPFYGSRRMTAARVLRREDWAVTRKRVRRLMRVMALQAIYQKPNTSRKHPDHKVYPYLLRGLDRPNQSLPPRRRVWCADITLHSDGQRVRVPGRGDGLVQPAGPGMAGVDQPGSGFLRRGVAGRDVPARPTRDFQH